MHSLLLKQLEQCGIHDADDIARDPGLWQAFVSLVNQTYHETEKANDHFQLLLNSTGEGIYGIDNAGLCTFANLACGKLLGYSVGDLVGKHMHTLVHYKHPDGSPHAGGDCPIYRSARVAAGCRVDDDAFWTRDGSPIWVEYTSYPMRSGSAVLGAVVAFSDIGNRKKVEAELRLAKEVAEQASRAKSEFLATMSHEIRTPLNGVVGMIDQLVHTELTAIQKRYAALAHLAGESLLSVINDILDFSKIEAAQIELEATEFDLHQLVADVSDLLQPVAAKQNLTLASIVCAEVPRQVRGDPARLRQVLLNLLNNAIKFTHEGSVALRVSVENANHPSARMVRAEVQDTGIGISPNRLDRLFKSFSQVDSSITRQFGGTGLGLAICKGLVELMGGMIDVSSEPGVGTTFWFTFPLNCAPEISATSTFGSSGPQPIPGEVAATEAIRGMHVLVAEDNEMNQFVTRETLRRAGCTCDMAANGALAIEAYQKGVYDIILMDCQMPIVDGMEATRRIRAMEMGLAISDCIPIIALTAEAVVGDRERCLASGMNGYVSKPINATRLFQEMMRVKAGQRSVNPKSPPKHAAAPTASA